jgi:DNA-binding protein HU-beta
MRRYVVDERPQGGAVVATLPLPRKIKWVRRKAVDVGQMPVKTPCFLDGPRAKGALARRPNSFQGSDPMNNSDLADKLAAAQGLTKADAAPMSMLFGVIVDAVAAGEEVSINGFGKFKVKESPAREGRNPSTGATIQIAASRSWASRPPRRLRTS